MGTVLQDTQNRDASGVPVVLVIINLNSCFLLSTNISACGVEIQNYPLLVLSSSAVKLHLSMLCPIFFLPLPTDLPHQATVVHLKEVIECLEQDSRRASDYKAREAELEQEVKVLSERLAEAEQYHTPVSFTCASFQSLRFWAATSLYMDHAGLQPVDFLLFLQSVCFMCVCVCYVCVVCLFFVVCRRCTSLSSSSVGYGPWRKGEMEQWWCLLVLVVHKS